ncbi:MAG: hypothetical protein LBH70_02375 [Spirochaetaceae bacterium]|jgi:hypothetical protein|nr:hypothetical protein [Spirochaetaceae bacterium]
MMKKYHYYIRYNHQYMATANGGSFPCFNEPSLGDMNFLTGEAGPMYSKFILFRIEGGCSKTVPPAMTGTLASQLVLEQPRSNKPKETNNKHKTIVPYPGGIFSFMRDFDAYARYRKPPEPAAVGG